MLEALGEGNRPVATLQARFDRMCPGNDFTVHHALAFGQSGYSYHVSSVILLHSHTYNDTMVTAGTIHSFIGSIREVFIMSLYICVGTHISSWPDYSSGVASS